MNSNGKEEWYAIRLKPMAARESKQDHRLTNIEFALRQEGFEYFFPLERKEIIHHRTKKPIDKRFPMIPGYAFVDRPGNWLRLRQTDFVAGILGVSGTPIVISKPIIDAIKETEEDFSEAYERQKEARRQKERDAEKHIPQRRARQLFPAGSQFVVSNTHVMLAGMRGTVKEATGRRTIKAIIETLNGMMNAEISLDDIESKHVA